MDLLQAFSRKISRFFDEGSDELFLPLIFLFLLISQQSRESEETKEGDERTSGKFDTSTLVFLGVLFAVLVIRSYELPDKTSEKLPEIPGNLSENT